jgi:hypothetical protein
LFRFQNNFWVNLHHVLRGESRRRSVKVPLKVKVEELKDEERLAWNAALDAYADFSRRDLIVDPQLVRANNALTTVTGESTLDPRAGLDRAAARALTIAAPVYRAHYWPAQRQLNDRWIAALQPAVARHGAAMADALAKAYHATWPADPILVDACAEAGPDGGYTTGGPSGTAAHSVIEAANPEYQGEMAFEMVFHEASHADALEMRITGAIDAEAARQGVTAPRNLWHVLIFYTVGELARRELGRAGDEHYLPYAYRYGLYTRGWQPLRDALARDWHPYLDGKTTFDAAMTALVRDTRQP